jgi:hypothetical protein
MTDNGDPQDLAEALDADKLDEDRIDSDGVSAEPDYPPDAALGIDDDTVTPRMEQVRESLADRVEREQADPLAEVLDETVEYEDDLAGASGPMEGAAGTAAVDDGDLGAAVGRLVEPGADDVLDAALDDEGTSIALDTGGDPDSADMSAEEAAVHVTDDPAMGRPDGGYLSDA